MATKNGVIKKTKLSAYANVRSNGVIAINLDDDDALIGVNETTGTDHIILGTRDGMTIRFDEQHVRSMGRVSRGVRGINLRGDDQVVGMVIVQESADLFTVCENGYGKRTDLDELQVAVARRPGSQEHQDLRSERQGCGTLKAVQAGDDLMLITANGMIIRTGLDEIRSIGRNTQGVRLIKLKEGDKLVAAEKIAAEDLEESEQTNEPSEAPTQDS